MQLIGALNRVDKLASVTAKDKDNGEVQLENDYNLLFDFIDRTPEKKATEGHITCPLCGDKAMSQPTQDEKLRELDIRARWSCVACPFIGLECY